MKKTSILLTFIFSIALLAGCEKQEVASIDTNGVAAALEDGTYSLDQEASNLYWKAFKLVSGETGGISISKGELIVRDGKPDQGSFTIDMNSITSESAGASLVSHLKSDDFFSVEDFPTSRFDISKVSLYEGDKDYNYQIEGDLSIKDTTEPVTLFAKIEMSGDKLHANAEVKIDRTKFGIIFRSSSFIEDLGDALIKDEFILEMDLVASQS